jgi:hypothetical protein
VQGRLADSVGYLQGEAGCFSFVGPPRERPAGRTFEGAGQLVYGRRPGGRGALRLGAEFRVDGQGGRRFAGHSVAQQEGSWTAPLALSLESSIVAKSFPAEKDLAIRKLWRMPCVDLAVYNISDARPNLAATGNRGQRSADGMKERRNKNEPVTVAVFDNPVQANLVKNALTDEGIQARLVDEHSVGMNWMLTNAIGGIKLVVRGDDYRDAMKILDKWSAQREAQVGETLAEQDDPAEAEDTEDDEEGVRSDKRQNRRAERRHSRDKLSQREQDAQRALFAAVLGLLFCPLELYASWLLLGVWLSGERLDPVYRRKAWVALAFNVPALLIYLLGIKAMFFSY